MEALSPYAGFVADRTIDRQYVLSVNVYISGVTVSPTSGELVVPDHKTTVDPFEKVAVSSKVVG